MDKNFGGVIWTNHALDRLRQRGIKQGDAWATFVSPEQSRYASTKGAWVYYKTYGTEKLEVVAKKNEEGKWVILTVWIRPLIEKHVKNLPQKRVTKQKQKKESFILSLLRDMFRVKR